MDLSSNYLLKRYLHKQTQKNSKASINEVILNFFVNNANSEIQERYKQTQKNSKANINEVILNFRN